MKAGASGAAFGELFTAIISDGTTEPKRLDHPNGLKW